MKRIFFGLLFGTLSVSAYAQFGQLIQSVTDQVTSAAQTQVNQGVRSATDEAVQSATTHTRKMIDSVRSSDKSTIKEGQDVKPQ
ncbi:hypothetical protein Bsp3421_000045 (plasmid) [Burkholderia sp. FERM BP-3421]|uniref:hypothetical protein n=1 Tax=Burkholderia sp. FERM BP-3421 TaxID=1494466 RepID=UPI002361D094|nr:hypothetical protein [Burkholderia sp. FERM BP-3421]WDD90225.1 hypothetical protein Bsp3421_000045 [Burkholderia sp. FERM BP-3421]